MFEHGLGELAVLAHPLRNHVPGVVGPAFQLRSVQQSLDEGVLRHLQGDDEVDSVPLVGQHGVQGPSLCDGAGKAVQQGADALFRLGQPGAHHVDDQLVRNEVARRHDPSHLLAQRCALGDLAA